MRIAADLIGDLTAQGAKPRKLCALCRFGQFPPNMQLGRAFGGAPTAFDNQRRFTKILQQVGELRRDIPGIKINHHGLHLQHMLGAGLAMFCDGAWDDINGATFARGPGGIGGEQFRRGCIGRDPDIVRLDRQPLPLIDKAAHRDQPLAIAEGHRQKAFDLFQIRCGRRCDRLPCGGKSVLQRRGRVVEIGPDRHAVWSQQRFAQGQKRHSK